MLCPKAKTLSSLSFVTLTYFNSGLIYFNVLCVLICLQCISPGLTETDFLAQPGSGHKIVDYMPKLRPKDVADALMYIITRPQHILVTT